MRSAPQFTPSVFGEGPTLTLHTVPIPILPPSNLKAFNLFHFNHLPPLCVSLPSFFARRPLFSITSSLFLQNTQGGGTSAHLAFGINNIQPFPAPSCNELSPPQSRVSFPVSFFAFRASCLDFSRPLFSKPYESLFPQLPCFHIHTKPRGVYPQTAGFCGNFRNYPLPTTHFNFRTTHYPLPTTHFPP